MISHYKKSEAKERCSVSHRNPIKVNREGMSLRIACNLFIFFVRIYHQYLKWDIKTQTRIMKLTSYANILIKENDFLTTTQLQVWKKRRQKIYRKLRKNKSETDVSVNSSFCLFLTTVSDGLYSDPMTSRLDYCTSDPNYMEFNNSSIAVSLTSRKDRDTGCGLLSLSL